MDLFTQSVSPGFQGTFNQFTPEAPPSRPEPPTAKVKRAGCCPKLGHGLSQAHGADGTILEGLFPPKKKRGSWVFSQALPARGAENRNPLLS